MPVLSKPSKWARSLVKSVKKRLGIKKIRQRLSDPFRKRVHSYDPSGPERGQSSTTTTEEPIPTHKSVGVQVSLPCRSLLNELSHEGSIDIMSHVYGQNSNQNNNSVDYRDTLSTSTSTAPPPSKDRVSTRHAGTSTGGFSLGKYYSSGSVSGSSPGASLLPSKFSKTTMTGTSRSHRSTGTSPSYNSGASSTASGLSRTHRSYGLGTTSRYPFTSSPSTNLPTSTYHGSSSYSKATVSVGRSPSPSRRRSQSLSHTDPKTTDKKEPSYLGYLGSLQARSPSPSTNRRRTYSSSDYATGRSSPLLQRRDHSVPTSLVRSPSPPPPPDYTPAPILTEKSKSLERLLYTEAGTLKPGSTATAAAASSQYTPSSGTDHRRSSVDTASSRHTSRRSPSPSRRHHDSKPDTSRVSSSEQTVSDARQRRAVIKRQESRTLADSTASQASSVKNSTTTTTPSTAVRGEKVASSNTDSRTSSLVNSTKRITLKRSNSTSSMADALKWEESGKGTSVGSTKRPTAPVGSFDDIQKAGRSSSPEDEEREKTPKHRVKKLLKKMAGKKTAGIQVFVSPSAIEQLFVVGGLVGLCNLGNTCYMNSMLQCLSHTLEMTQIFLHPEFDNRKPLTKAYTELMKDLWYTRTPLSISPTSYSPTFKYCYPNDFKRALGSQYPVYSGSDQHDAQEFLRYLLGGLHEDMKMQLSKKYWPFKLTEKKNKSLSEQADHAWQSYRLLEDSFISEVFMGQLKSTLQCSVCKGSSVTFDPCWDICLPIPTTVGGKASSSSSKAVSLYDCFEEFSQYEVLDGDEKPMCATCDKCQKCYKRMTIQRFPPVLVLVLKRFTGYRFRTKLETNIGIPQMLDLSHFVSPDFTGKPPKYELYATSNHSGTVFFGHYTAWAKHYATQEWYEFDDKSVYKMESHRSITKSTVYSAKPYVLFYRQLASDN